MGAMRRKGARLAQIAGLLLAIDAAACASIPASRYGVESLTIDGVEALDADALKACLTTTERPSAGFDFGAQGTRVCGEPPFDAWHAPVRLWSWWFTDWPLYDRSAVERDRERILRWYAARGFHSARVVSTSVEPEAAERRDTLDPLSPTPGCPRVGTGEGCTVRVRMLVEEGEPTRVTSLEFHGLDGLPKWLRNSLLRPIRLRRGARFDEADFESEKQRIRSALHEQGHALARVTGEVRIDAENHSASVALHVTPGPRCQFGAVIVEGAPPFLEPSVRATTLIDRGDPFSLEALESAQRAVFSSGGYASVNVEPILPTQGNVVDVRVTVNLARKRRFGLGFGVQAGIVTRGDTWEPLSIPQWDIHLVAKYTRERFLNGPRTLVFSDHPAMIVQEPFPGFAKPRLGNDLRAQLRQAGVFEPRTAMQVSGSYTWGPDSFDTFFRHRVDTSLGFERLFLRRERLFVSVGVKNSTYRVPSGEVTMDGDAPPASSRNFYLYQRTRLDFRDDAAQPHKGFLLQTELQEGGLAGLSSWRYVRSTPDLRLYAPLPLRTTFAVRFALGMYFIFEADQKLEELSQKLGPRDYRLRGGGATSNRGFLPGQLGDGPDGGTRRWEASAELRLPLTASLGLVGFFDVGDVSQKTTFRWDHPQASSGMGLRYRTLVGPLRLDFAWRIKNMQVFGPDERSPGGSQNTVDFGFFKLHGAIHLTLGESF